MQDARSASRSGRVFALLLVWLFATSPGAQAQPADAGAAADAKTLDPQAARKALGRGLLALGENPPDRAAAQGLFESALAASDKQIVAEAHFRLGSMYEQEGAYARSFEEYQACIAASSSGRIGRNAWSRAEWLKARSEGDFVPLSRSWAVRSNPAFARDPLAVEAFVREAGAFPPGIVRSEARMAGAEALLGMDRVDEAISLFVLVRDDPRSLGTTIGLAEDHVVQALLDAGRLTDAADEVERRGALASPERVANVRRLVRRRLLRQTAIAALAACIVYAAVSVAWAGRRGRSGLAVAWRALRRPSWRGIVRGAVLVAGAYAVLAAVLVALRHDPVRSTSCMAVATAAVPITLGGLALDAAGSRSSIARRRLIAAMCVVAYAGTTYLVLSWFLPAYLDYLGI